MPGGRWDEYVLTLHNAGTKDVVIRAIAIESAHLPPGIHVTRRHLLERATNENIRLLKSAGVDADLGPEQKVECDPDDAAHVVGGALLGTVITIATVVAGAGMFGWALVCAGEEEMRRYGYNLPLDLAPTKGFTRSAFVPLMPAPDYVRVDYDAAGERRSLRVKLEGLAGLHRRGPVGN
jgi:hypothetical protein